MLDVRQKHRLISPPIRGGGIIDLHQLHYSGTANDTHWLHVDWHLYQQWWEQLIVGWEWTGGDADEFVSACSCLPWAAYMLLCEWRVRPAWPWLWHLHVCLRPLHVLLFVLFCLFTARTFHCYFATPLHSYALWHSSAVPCVVLSGLHLLAFCF